MTKKPPQDEFRAKFMEVNGDKHKLAEFYQCTLQSIYNWIESLINETEGQMEKEKELEYEDYVKIHNDSIIKPRNREITVKVKGNILVINLSDFHLGSAYVDTSVLDEVIDFILNAENVYAIFAGDIVDFTPGGHDDLRHEQIFSNPKFAKDWAVKTISKIGHKMLAMVSGCHDDWQYEATGEFLGDELAKHTITKCFVPDCLMMNISVGKEPYRVYVTHKLKSKSLINPSAGMFRKAREDLDFDVGVQAHLHVPAVAQMMIRNRVITAINCGSIKKGDMYAGKLGIINQRASLIPAFELNSEKHGVNAYISFRDTPQYKSYIGTSKNKSSS